MFTKQQTFQIISFAYTAGEIAEAYFNSPNLKITTKPDNSRVSEADLEISKFLEEKLSKEFPQIPVICEENSRRDFQEEVFWLIDPIDGTSSFIEGSNQFAVNIALIKNQKPIFGLIYAPLFEGGKMFFTNHKLQLEFLDKKKNSQIIQINSQSKQGLVRIIVSPRVKESDVKRFTDKFLPQKEIVLEILSSAVKFFRMFEGKADIFLHLRQSHEWDIAPGQALLENINGKVKILDFNDQEIFIQGEMTYKKPGFVNTAFIANFY